MALSKKEMTAILVENKVEVPKYANAKEIEALYNIFQNDPESLKNTSHDSLEDNSAEDTAEDADSDTGKTSDSVDSDDQSEEEADETQEVSSDDSSDEPASPSEFLGEETQSPVLGEAYRLKTSLKVGGRFVKAGTVLSADEFGDNQEGLVQAGFIEAV
jgi:hypothetical protein